MVLSPWTHPVKTSYFREDTISTPSNRISDLRPKWFSYLKDRNFGINTDDHPVLLDPIVSNWLFTDVDAMNVIHYKELDDLARRYYLKVCLMFLLSLHEKPLINKIAQKIQSFSNTNQFKDLFISESIDKVTVHELIQRLNLFGKDYTNWYPREETEQLIEKCLKYNLTFLACELVHRGFEVSFSFCITRGDVGSLLFSIQEGNNIGIRVPQIFMEDHIEPFQNYKIAEEDDLIISGKIEIKSNDLNGYCSISEIYNTQDICEETGAEIITLSSNNKEEEKKEVSKSEYEVTVAEPMSIEDQIVDEFITRQEFELELEEEEPLLVFDREGLIQRYRKEQEENEYLLDHPTELIVRLEENDISCNIEIDEEGMNLRDADGHIKVQVTEALREMHEKEAEHMIEYSDIKIEDDIDRLYY